MARWIKNGTREHVCTAPEVEDNVSTGDVWLCDCGEAYVVFFVSWHKGRVEEFVSTVRSDRLSAVTTVVGKEKP